MRSCFFIVPLVAVLFSCKPKNTGEIKTNLKAAMQQYLYAQINNDSTYVKYFIEDVTYNEDSNIYICAFKVHFKENKFDTTGIMQADISKDFKTVKRLK